MKFSLVSLLALGACIAYRSVNAQCKSASAAFSATEIATYNASCTGAGCVEVLAYDKKTKLVAVVLSTNSSVVILDLADPYKPVQIYNIKMGSLHGETGYGAPNSVTAYNGYIAVAMDAEIKTNPGYVRLYSLEWPGFMKVGEIMVAAIPDMIIFSADGKKLYIACEGEPSTQEITGSDPNVGANPSGTFDILNVTWNSTGFPSFSGKKSLDFQTYIDNLTDTQYTNLLTRGMKIDPRVNKSRAAVDIEPEYIALSDDGMSAYVTLQENSAIAVIDLVKEAIVDIRPLGARSLNNSIADLSDKNLTINQINMTTWTNVNLWYQPDTIDFKTIGGVGYLFTANEGDSKEEKRRVKDVMGTNGVNFDATAFPNATALIAESMLGRFNMDPLSGIKGGYNTSKAWNAQGPYNQIYGYGARSFSIIRASDGLVVFDSGSKMEELIAADSVANKCFNCDRDANTVDGRSDDAGIEPEGIATVQLGECSYAIIGLERQSGLMIFDVTNPSNATYVNYIVNRNFTTTSKIVTSGNSKQTDAVNAAAAAELGHLAPEMIKIISAKSSPVPGRPLMLVTNEFSGTVIVYLLPGSTTPKGTFNSPASFAKPISYTILNNSKVYVLFGVRDGSNDNRLTWSAAASACRTIAQGSLIMVNDTQYNAAMSALLNSYPGGSQLGMRKECAWVGATNVKGTGYTVPDFSTNDMWTAENLWNENLAAVCGAHCLVNGAWLKYKRDCDYEPQAFVCLASNTFNLDSQYICTQFKSVPEDDGLIYTLATFNSTSELSALIAILPLNSSNTGYWTGAVKPGYSTPTWIQTIVPSDDTFLATATIAAPPTDQSWVPRYAYDDMGLPSNYTGNCLNGYGCGVAITFTNKTLQYLDPGFTLGVVCKAKLASNPAPSGATPPLPPATATAGVKVSSTVRMGMSRSTCRELRDSANANAQFSRGLNGRIVTAWNKVFLRPAQQITLGDVQSNVAYACDEVIRRRSLFQSGSSDTSTATSTSTVSAPNDVTASEASSSQASFNSEAATSISTSSFAATYGVTGVTVAPTQASSSSTSSTDIPLIVGLTVGIVVPALVAIGVVAYIISKRRAKQSVAAKVAPTEVAPTE